MCTCAGECVVCKLFTHHAAQTNNHMQKAVQCVYYNELLALPIRSCLAWFSSSALSSYMAFGDEEACFLMHVKNIVQESFVHIVFFKDGGRCTRPTVDQAVDSLCRPIHENSI